jgi:hypothetical protein
MLTITKSSHLDHGLQTSHVRFLLEKLGDRDAFFLTTLELPGDLPGLSCALRGPAVGLPPVPDALVELRCRPGRSYPSRMLRKDLGQDSGTHPLWRPVLTRQMTVIAGPGLGLPCVLYTAFGGPAAPREPADPSLPEAERAASVAFWSEHALAE